MAKGNSIIIRLVDTEGTGHFYTGRKNPRNTTEKLLLNKYNPVLKRHTKYKEAKIK